GTCFKQRAPQVHKRLERGGVGFQRVAKKSLCAAVVAVLKRDDAESVPGSRILGRDGHSFLQTADRALRIASSQAPLCIGVFGGSVSRNRGLAYGNRTGCGIGRRLG